MDIYDSIPEGYYLKVMTEGGNLQRFWHQYHFSQISARIPENPALTVLDLGSGPGAFFFQHKKRAKKIGIDVAQSQIDYVKKIMPDVKWICSDIENCELPKADYVILSQVLEHLNPDTKIMQNIYKALRKGGKLIITTPNYRSMWPIVEHMWEFISPVKYEEQHINPQTLASLKKLGETNGFKLIEMKTLFLFTPFIALISYGLAKKLVKLEKEITGKFGLIILAIFEK